MSWYLSTYTQQRQQDVLEELLLTLLHTCYKLYLNLPSSTWNNDSRGLGMDGTVVDSLKIEART
jgi:hypothetical protein